MHDKCRSNLLTKNADFPLVLEVKTEPPLLIQYLDDAKERVSRCDWVAQNALSDITGLHVDIPIETRIAVRFLDIEQCFTATNGTRRLVFLLRVCASFRANHWTLPFSSNISHLLQTSPATPLSALKRISPLNDSSPAVTFPPPLATLLQSICLPLSYRKMLALSAFMNLQA